MEEDSRKNPTENPHFDWHEANISWWAYNLEDSTEYEDLQDRLYYHHGIIGSVFAQLKIPNNVKTKIFYEKPVVTKTRNYGYSYNESGGGGGLGEGGGGGLGEGGGGGLGEGGGGGLGDGGGGCTGDGGGGGCGGW